MNRYDFLVVGGGPIGCRAAYKLSKAGYQVAVLEKNPSVGGPVCCTGIVSRECLRRFSIPPELVLKELNSASVFSPSGKSLRLERSEVQAAVIDRGAFNAWMARQAQDEGVDYKLAHNVTDVMINPDGVMLKADRRGKEEHFEAHALVLACGFGSRLPEKLGFDRARDWTVGAQAEVEAPDLAEVEGYLGRDVAPGFFGWLVPSGGSTALAGLMAGKEAGTRLEAFLALLKKQGRIKAVTGKPAYRGITLTTPRQTYANRILLAGDAAGQVKPLTGGGLFFGLLCADIAADTLHSALEKGDFSASRLSSYQKEWKRLLGWELRLGGWAHRLYGRLSDARLEWLVALAERKGLAARLSASSGIGFDWHGSAMLHIVKQVVWPSARRPSPGTPANNPQEERSHV
ncbi:MAG: NAD(P)/FAD-dependent oxidoreductase [Dehalococcoidia bacterium]|nr:MAG: NAD(P)/FAD-dependent oxidoreductase [Dehalococcoidia bacterium]